jgi:hypothetical protein
VNEQVKQAWLAALRSGDYEQTKGALRKDDGYCCLGVLCDLAVQEGVVDEWVDDGFEGIAYYYFGIGRSIHDGDLPWPVMEWAGLTESNPLGGDNLGDSHDRGLAGYNDSGATFKQIADVIEARL